MVRYNDNGKVTSKVDMRTIKLRFPNIELLVTRNT